MLYPEGKNISLGIPPIPPCVLRAKPSVRREPIRQEGILNERTDLSGGHGRTGKMNVSEGNPQGGTNQE